MDLSLNALVEELDDSLFEQASRDFRLAAGHAPASVTPLPVLTQSDELFRYLSELVASPRTDAGKRARLELLRRYAAQVYVAHAAAPAGETLAQRLASDGFLVGPRAWKVGEALAELPRLASREARATLEAELGVQLTGVSAAWARRADRLLEAATGLAGSARGFVELTQGRALGPRLEAAAALLRQTEDAYLDLLGFALKRLEPTLTRKAASRHDVDRVLLAPWLSEQFGRGDLQHAVTRTLGDLGLNPAAEGRLTLDAEPRPGKRAGNHLFELRVPAELRLVLTLESGLDAYAGWLRTWGRAMHRAHVGRALPFVERRLGDPAVIDGFALVFEGFLLEEGWLRRYLRLTPSQAREATRMMALRALTQLRHLCALSLVDAALQERGSVTPELREQAQLRVREALGVDGPADRALLDLEVLGAAPLQLDAVAFAEVLRGQLTERCNEDFYRNPAAGRLLVGVAAVGQRDDVAAVADSLSAGPPAVTAAARRLVDLMGA